MREGLKDKFSIAHWDISEEDNSYIEAIENASDDFREEIKDIYFGYPFNYRHKNQDKVLGNVMQVYASDKQIDNLFMIQDKYNIDISLTFNSLDIPDELLNDMDVQDQFLNFLDGFYKRGLRSITLSMTHLVRQGIIQQRFPHLRIKNTVNHLVKCSQQVMDFMYLGYDTILIDRSLNRDLKELKKIRRAVDLFNSQNIPGRKKVLISLLISEGCVGNCPFKNEHDTFKAGNYFQALGEMSCNRWRINPITNILPRNGVDAFWLDKETFEEYSSLIDIFKFNGRLSQTINVEKMVWFNQPTSFSKPIYMDSFSSILDSDINMISDFVPFYKSKFNSGFDGDIKKEILRKYEGYNFDSVKELNQILKNCEGSCWDCHKCEETFMVPNYNSALQL